MNSQPSREALRSRILAGLLYAAGRFVPMPLLDDWVRERIARWMVENTVPISLRGEATRPLWTDQRGCLHGCLGGLLLMPIRLILYPIRTLLMIVLGVRWISRDVAEMLLLGRVIDHAIATGVLDPSLSPSELSARSKALRASFEAAIAQTDTHLMTALIATALGPLRDLLAAAMRTLNRFRMTEDAPTVAPSDAPVIEASVDRIERSLIRPEAVRFLAEFDARFLSVQGRVA